MPLLNYSTQVDARKSAAEIQGKLVYAGARRLMIEYDEKGEPAGIAFEIDVNGQKIPFKLPANVGRVLEALKKEYALGKIRSQRYTTHEQAARVAWRILKDWIEAQLALISTNMVTLDEVMLPYAVLTDGRTLYENVLDSGFKQLGSGN